MQAKPMNFNPRRQAFSLIELLVVISVIGVLAAVGIPALKGMGGTTATSAAVRQLLDDLAYARNKAMNQRTTVYMVFASPQVINQAQSWSVQERKEVAKYANLQYTSYALFARRGLGDQPGSGVPRYLTDWRTLPDGMFIPTNKFNIAYILDRDDSRRLQVPLFDRPLLHTALPFPHATNRTILLPYIAFDYQGRLTQTDDVILPVSRGSIVYPQDDPQKRSAGVLEAAEVIETPRGNSTNNPSIRIDWLTGRARPVQPEKVDYAAVR